MFTLQEFGVDEQLQRQEEHHQEDAGHQDAVEAGAEQADLPQGHAATTAGLQPVGPAEGKRAHVQQRPSLSFKGLTRSRQGAAAWPQEKKGFLLETRGCVQGTAGPCEETTSPDSRDRNTDASEMKGAAVEDVVWNELHS